MPAMLVQGILFGFMAFVAVALLFPRNVRTPHWHIVASAAVVGLLVAAAVMVAHDWQRFAA